MTSLGPTYNPVSGRYASGRLEMDGRSGTVYLRYAPADDPDNAESVRLGHIAGDPLGNAAWDAVDGDLAEFGQLEADLAELEAVWGGAVAAC